MAEAPYRSLVTALWVLLRTAATGAVEAESSAAAESCWQRLGEALRGESHVVLQERGGALFVNGLRIRPDMAAFAATAGVIALMQDQRISDVLLTSEAKREDLELLGRLWGGARRTADLEAELQRRGCLGVHLAQGESSADAPFEVVEGGTVRASAPSQLGTVFTMQRFARALSRRGPLSGVAARALLQNVLSHMLRQPGGLDPLDRIESGDVPYATAVRACVLAVRAGERLHWDDERCLRAGASALVGGLEVEGDVEATELARSACTVGATLATTDSPEEALSRVFAAGQVPGLMLEAMERVLVSASR